MNARHDEPEWEVERYELSEAPPYRFDVDRRTFLKTVGSGLVVVMLLATAAGQQPGGRRGGRRGPPRPAEIGAWLRIGEDGVVTVFTGKTEVGQNIRTSLTQAVAEELPAPLSSIRLVMADTAQTPYDAGTFGSRTTPDMAQQLHRVAAAAREALLDLGAEHFKVDRATLTIGDGKVTRPDTKEAVTFGQLTKGQKLMKAVDAATPIVPAAKWKIAGTSLPKVDGRDYVTGKHQYTSDLTRPGMLHGKILRPPSFDATLVSADPSAAEKMPGVAVVRDGNFIGVAAPDVLTAERALAAIKAEWNENPGPSNAGLWALLKENAPPAAVPVAAAGEQRLRHSYHIAYIAHAPLEPRAAVAEWKDGALTVWTGTQRPFGVRGDLMQAFGLAEDKVRVIVPDTGSGYGGKHTTAAATEAARLAKAAGKPVKLVWTREEEFTWAYFRPAGVIDIAATVKDDGTLTAWEQINYNSGGSAVRSPYDVPGQRAESRQSRSPLKQGSYRGLAATANVFAREMHMDELARAVKLDPLEFRLRNLKEPRLRAVLEAAAKSFGWGKVKPAAGHGHGLGCGTEKNSFVAACADVAADRASGQVQVVRVVVAFECGAIVNPDQLKSQVEGCIVMGLGGALWEAIEFAEGKIKNPKFSKYRVPRFADTPKIEVVLLDRKDLPSSGAGETPIVAIAPAVGNAIFAATGIQLTSLPMIPNGLKE
jgi:CO/xanthine dehydrogenase Mo-binding subunit